MKKRRTADDILRIERILRLADYNATLRAAAKRAGTKPLPLDSWSDRWARRRNMWLLWHNYNKLCLGRTLSMEDIRAKDNADPDLLDNFYHRFVSTRKLVTTKHNGKRPTKNLLAKMVRRSLLSGIPIGSYYAHMGGCSDDIEIDRIIPGSQGGTYELGNCVFACGFHNRSRGDMGQLEFFGNDKQGDVDDFGIEDEDEDEDEELEEGEDSGAASHQ